MPAVQVKSILHRNNPIIQSNPPHRLPSLWSLGFHLQKAAVLWNILDKQVPGVKGVWMLEEAALHSIVVTSLKQMYPGHAKAAAMTASGCNAINYCCRCIVVVDDDIDPSNKSEVLWALGTRMEPQNSSTIPQSLLMADIAEFS